MQKIGQVSEGRDYPCLQRLWVAAAAPECKFQVARDKNMHHAAPQFFFYPAPFTVLAHESSAGLCNMTWCNCMEILTLMETNTVIVTLISTIYYATLETRGIMLQ